MKTTKSLKTNAQMGKSFLVCLFNLILLLFINNAFAQKTAVGGNWSASASWSPAGVPVSTDAVTIPNGVNITVDVSNATCASVAVNNGVANGTGTLQFNSGSVLTVSGGVTLGSSGLKVGNLTMTFGGTLKIGTSLTVSNGTFTPGIGTVEYNGTAQTIYATAYNNLTLSGSGTKTTP